MRLPVFALASACLLGLSMLLARGLDGPTGARPSDAAPADAAPADVAPANTDPVLAPAPAARPIAPEAFAPLAPDLVERDRPREPLSDLALASPPPAQPEVWKGTLLHRPVATAAGVVEARGYRVAVDGVVPLQPDARCGEAQWPCGVHARTAFRAWLRGRSLECDLPAEAPAGDYSVRCKLGKQDAAAWLVRNGWAKIESNLYLAEETQARERKAGMWGDGGRE